MASRQAGKDKPLKSAKKEGEDDKALKAKANEASKAPQTQGAGKGPLGAGGIKKSGKK